MIIWIDDDSRSLQAYVDELEDNNYKVSFTDSIDEFWDYLYDYDEDITCLIIDILMPTLGIKNRAKAKMGMRTGLALIDEIYAKKKFKNLPIIIFTISNDSKIYSVAKKYGVNVLMKQATLPADLLDVINNIV